ncbi:unnamed protein product [Pedinophyceae sp. YPF-701]|nr:unnamed protein product [Pedinophyceae sp. YPF-701]
MASLLACSPCATASALAVRGSLYRGLAARPQPARIGARSNATRIVCLLASRPHLPPGFAPLSFDPRGARCTRTFAKRKAKDPDFDPFLNEDTMPEDAKRKAEAAEGGTPKKAATAVPLKCNKKRWRELRPGEPGSGPVVYWMERDRRASDNWALIHAIEVAQAKNTRVVVAFSLVSDFIMGGGARQHCFMLRGLKELKPKLEGLNIPFYLLRGDPRETIPALCRDLGAGLLVTDFHPMRLQRSWRDGVAKTVLCPMHEVDAHNVVPVWVASDKREYAARTIRPKIHAKLGEFLKDFPELPEMPEKPVLARPAEHVDFDAIIKEANERGAEVPEVTWITAGETAAMEALVGEEGGFLTKARLPLYDAKRNDPTVPHAQSGMSAWIRFGHISAQRCAIEAQRRKTSSTHKAVESFLEELVVRKELSDNFCFYTPNYDSLECASEWAQETLRVHAKDKREHLYTREQLEAGKTHDDLWNAAQKEMVHLGKMHGWVRMYWAKKILEWTASPEEALDTALYLNDRYELDGRCPNAVVGCMWSVAGIHDMGWTERPIFGKIRYMNYNSTKKKFNIPGYIALVDRRVGGKGSQAQAVSKMFAAAETKPKKKAKKAKLVDGDDI